MSYLYNIDSCCIILNQMSNTYTSIEDGRSRLREWGRAHSIKTSTKNLTLLQSVPSSLFNCIFVTTGSFILTSTHPLSVPFFGLGHCPSKWIWIQNTWEEVMPTPQRTSDDANPETTYRTTKFCYKFDFNIIIAVSSAHRLFDYVINWFLPYISAICTSTSH